MYFDRDGNAIDLWQWTALVETPDEYRRVGSTRLHGY